MISSLATPFVPLRTLKSLKRKDGTEVVYRVPRRANQRAYGFCVHTSGSGVATRAAIFARNGKNPAQDTPEEVAIWCYSALWSYFTTYLIVNSGKLYAICDEDLRAPHAGFTDPTHRGLCLSGAWRQVCSPAGVRLWDARWPGRKSPAHLYPSRNPNEDFISVELVPLLKADATGSLFTPAQYGTLGRLIKDVQTRHGKVVLGHEDLNPFSGKHGRWDRSGGWDPGALRARPYFDWARVVV